MPPTIPDFTSDDKVQTVGKKKAADKAAARELDEDAGEGPRSKRPLLRMRAKAARLKLKSLVVDFIGAY